MAEEIKKEQQNVQLPEDPRDDDMGLKYIDKDFVYDTMSVPTHSGDEYRLVEYIVFWCLRNGIKYEFDSYGNIYLTKGEIAEGEYYPCLTSHLDTVQTKQATFARFSVNMKIVTTRTNEGHKIAIDGGIGIGADDKGGVCISLSMFKYFDKLKACFFLEEEKGCIGSGKMEKEWFDNVGYVIGYDSPDLFRAAWACSGVKLFSYDFYENYIKPVCDKWGLKKGCFFSEPYTDVKNIRIDTHIACMNFGNGGYGAHGPNEYSVIEHMDHALGMGIDLVKHIGLTRHIIEDTSTTSKAKPSFFRRQDGLIGRKETDDTKLLEGLGSVGSQSQYKTTTYKTVSSKEDELEFESVEYIVSRYEEYIEYLKNKTIADVKELNNKGHLTDTELTEAITAVFSKKVTF
jgi:hypothetical protein